MAGTGRNDPCPCGSGKKYKKCCLEREHETQANEFPPYERSGPAEKALAWINESFPGDAGAAVVEEYCDGLAGHELEELRKLPDDIRGMFVTNANEWLLAEGRHGKGRRFIDLVLGEKSPALTPDDRRFLRALGSTGSISMRSSRLGPARV